MITYLHGFTSFHLVFRQLWEHHLASGYNLAFILIIGITSVFFIIERWLSFLNSNRYNQELPAEVQDVYGEEEYKKSQHYKKVNERFGLLTDSFSFFLIMLVLFFHVFGYLDQMVRSVTEHPILVALIFFGIIMLFSDLVNTPFALYDTFVIEEKFGFNKTTLRTFILDKIKGLLLSAVLGGGILSLIIWLYLKTHQQFWIFAWIAVSAVTLFMTMFYSTLIVPIFNKQTPLAAGDLRNAISNFCTKVGFKLDNVFVMDGSKRSTKSNAYFTGIGPKKRIVLYDTLINDLSTEEIVAVLAHEIGHNKKKHAIWSIMLGILQYGITFYIFSLFMYYPIFSQALGAEVHSIHVIIVAFGIIYSPVSMVIGLLLKVLSRKHEYQADRFVKEKYQASALISALKKLSSKNLSNLTPHPAYVFYHYSHPTLWQRIRALQSE